MNYNYFAKITFEDGNYYVSIPDIQKEMNGFVNDYETYADNLDDALKYAKEIIVLYLKSFKDENKSLPIPSNFKDLKRDLKDNQFIASIHFNYNYEEALVNNAIKNKTVVLPVWLDILAQEKKINFSQLLQKALKKELNLE